VVDRKTSTLTYLNQDGQPQLSTYVSLGRAGVETPDGDYSTMGKYRFDNMTSASVSQADHEYYLPNVPFTQYYRDGGYAIHSTYWHDHFGSVESQGCINLTWADGAYLFSQTKPDVAEGDVARWALGSLPSTPVVIVN
jgi:lipoprotein-anchoring transpeptidase ErfK/SrfK